VKRCANRSSFDLLLDAVDPSEAERFIDGVVVRDAWLTAALAVIDEPDLALGLVMFAEPRAPVGDAMDVESARDLRLPSVRSSESKLSG
jgi:hypothetical protein